MRYATGQLVLTETDLDSYAFGLPWRHGRSYSNLLGSNTGGINGNSWLVTELKSLVFIGVSFGNNYPDQICLVIGGTTSLWFLRQSDGVTYLPQFSGYDVLTYDADNDQFIWTTAAGQQTTFYDNASNAALAGQIKAIVDRSGNTVTASYTGNQLTQVEQTVGGETSDFSYAYYESGVNAGLLASVTLSVNGSEVRQTVYGYYTGAYGENGGNVDDLKSVSIQQFDSVTEGWVEVSAEYYEYYVPGDSSGFVHGLKYLLRGTAYQNMVAAGLNPETAPETQLAQYADFYFEYDGEQRVSLERVEGGRKEYAFAYWNNPASPDFSEVNVWATQTIETLPDGNQNRVYTNAAGQILLKILKDTGSGDEWYSYNQYDSGFNVALMANSAAVESVTEPTTGDPTLSVDLQTDAGLIQGQVFYASTDPATGTVEGRLQMQTVQEGSAGTPVTVRSVTYTSQTAFGQTIYPLATESVYPAGSAVTTSYDYTYYADGSGNPTFQIEQKTTTYPAVPTDQNGSDAAGAEQSYYDIYGRLIWHMNQQGAISYIAYDNVTGAVIQKIADVDTAVMTGVPAGWTTVPGWGLQLVSDFIVDALGRVLQARGPVHDVQLQPTDTAVTSIRTVQFSAYLDESHETRQAVGYMIGSDPTATFQTVGSVTITRSNDGGSVVDRIQAVRASNSGPLTTTEEFPQSAWNRWTHKVYDNWNRTYAYLVYYQIPAYDTGDPDVNYLQTIYGYNAAGRQNRVIQPSGTIHRMVHDARGLVVSNWIGTDDAGATDSDPTGGGAAPNNMSMVSAQEYDGGASGGDGNLTQLTQPVDDNSANDRITNYEYDYRDRRTTTTQADGTTTWETTTTYDNQNRPLQNSTSVVGGNLIAQSRTYYDLLGRIYLQETDGVDPSTGTVVNTLASQNWYDLGKNVIKESKAGATSFTKTIYDALNRATVAYLACVPGTAGVPAGDDNDVSSDTVFEQNETAYDPAGNTILATRRQRLDSATGTGALQDVDTEPEARVSFVASWPDAIGRVRVTADYGTNGGTALIRPDVAPAPSDTVLVTTYLFKSDGEANAIIDPMGLETRWNNDNAGRRICLIENYVSGSVANMRISRYTWHASGQMEKLTLQNSVTGDQVTQWIYGTTLYDSGVADNNLVRAKIYPESDDWPSPLGDGPDGIYERLEYTYNRQGQTVTFEDADETMHAYVYDGLGRLIADSVTALGEGLDDSVLRIERAYEVRGMLQTVTSYDAAAGGSVVNQSAFSYDAFTNLIADQQSHSGAVVSGTTPEVGYSYADGSANTVRRTAVTYPDGQMLNTAYGAANSAADHLNQIASLNVAGESGDLADYTYCGVAWQVQIQYPQPGVELTYIKQGSEPVGDGGDPYTGYDRFGRTIDIRWQTIGTGASLERLKYGFDRDSRRVWRQRVLATGLDNAYTYDGLSQVTGNAVGILDVGAGTIDPVPAQTEAWNYDPTGNWSGYTTTASGTVTLDQTRIHDQGNRLMQIETDPNPIIVDRVGRMLEVPPDATGDWSESLTLVWDAWSRVVEISDGGSVVGAYTYDGLARRMTRTAGGVTWHSYYSDAWRPLEERQDAQTTATAQYVWGGRHRDDLIRRDRATTSGGSLDETRYVLMDYFSPASITDQTGAVTERYAFTAFGVRSILAPDFTPIASSECDWTFAFQGQFLDEESGFLNYGYRYDSAYLGRWMSKDPIEERGGNDLYCFVKNRSINKIDILGLGEWHVGIDNSGSAFSNSSVDAYYTLDDQELKCCQVVRVTRFVKGILQLWSEDGGQDNYFFQPQLLGPNDRQAHAPMDAPGVNPVMGALGLGFLVGYRITFQYEAVCTQGSWHGRIISTYETTITTGGGRASTGGTGKPAPKNYPSGGGATYPY